jgi:PAS domain S-box-containing protein
MYPHCQTASSSHDELTDLRTRLSELERESANLKWANDAIHALASGIGRATGQEFFQSMTRLLSTTLQVGYVFITERVPGRTDRLRVVAGWCRNHASKAYEYDLSHTPCKKVLEEGEAFFPHGTRQLFPDDEYLTIHNIESYMGTALFTGTGRQTGHLCIMDDSPFLFDQAQGHAVVKAFAERAGAELERLQAEEALRQREERFRVLYDHNPSMYFTLSPDGTIVSVNQHGATQLGYTTGDLVGRSVLVVFDAADRQTVLSQLKQCTNSPFQTFAWEIQKTRKDGSRLWVYERARAIIDSDGTLTILIVCEDVTERRRTNHLLSTLIHKSPLPIVSLDHKAHVTSWNQAAMKLFGWSEEEVLGRELPYVRPGEEAVADSLWEAGTRGEIVGPIELRRQRKDGTHVDLLLWPVFVREHPGELSTAIGIYVDQSNLIQAETARRESERRLRTIIASDPECVKIVSPDGLLTSINPAGLAMIGAASEQAVVGRSVFPLVHPLDRVAYEQFHRMVCAGESGILSFRIVDLQGTERCLEAHSVPLRNDDGIITGALSITRDITSRKQTEQALRESEERFRLIAETVEEVFWSADPSIGKMLYVSPAYERIWGRTCASLYAHPRSFLDAIHPDDRGRIVANLTIQREGLPFGHEYRVVRPDGEIRWVWDRGFPVRDQGTGNLTHYVGVALDITARKQSEALLEGEMHCLELIAKDTPLPAVLETLCAMIERQNPALLCSILLLDSHTGRLHACAAPSLPSAYVHAIDGVAIGPAVGSCGTAAFHATPAIVADIAQDPLWASCRSLALDHGLRACWSMPILSPSKQVLGTFAIYSRRPNQPTPTDLSLMKRATHLAGIAIMKDQVSGEREQLSRDLHDNILQSLYAVGMQMEAAKLAREKSPRKCNSHIAQAIGQLNHLVLDVRQFIALLTQRNAVQSDFGEALRQLAISMCAAKQAPLELEINDGILSKLTSFQGQQLLNITREALSNSMRHAQAERRWVKLSHTADTIRLVIGDDGIGFAAGRPLRRGHGLANMAARAKTLRALFSLDTAPGKGTCITVDAPIEEGSSHGEVPSHPIGDRRRPRSRAHRTQRGT